MTPPNIIYLHSHDSGRYVQPYGYAIPTPRIQALAEEGVIFRQAFNAAPTCSPSRAGLVTGQSPHSCGQFGLVNRGFELRDRYKHIAHTLHNAGYETALAGVHHVVRDPLTCGYERVLERPVLWGDAATAQAASAFLAQPHQRPFFLAVGFIATHRTFPELDQPEDARYVQPPAPLPDTPETRYDMARYIASARALDDYVGTVLDAVEANGLSENTLVICTTDHGIAFPQMKCNLTDHGTGVMLIMRGPGGFGGGQVLDALVSQMDLFPTLCELADIDAPSWLEGVSLMPLIRGETDSIREQVTAEVNYHCHYEPLRMVRTKRWKYIHRYATYGHPLLANTDDGPSKSLLLDYSYAQRLLEVEELYDLIYDPNEACNLIHDPSLADVVQEMRERLDRWMESSQDPLLYGEIAAPETGVVSRPEDISPSDVWSYQERREGYA